MQFRQLHVVEPGPVGGPFGQPPNIVGCKTCRKNLFEEIGQSFGNPNHSKCGKSTENSKMTRSPALVARLNLIGSQQSRDPKWRLLIGPCNDQGAVIGTLHNWKFNTSEIRFFTERIDIPGNRVLCYKVPSVDYRRIADCYRYCM